MLCGAAWSESPMNPRNRMCTLPKGHGGEHGWKQPRERCASYIDYQEGTVCTLVKGHSGPCLDLEQITPGTVLPTKPLGIPQGFKYVVDKSSAEGMWAPYYHDTDQIPEGYIRRQINGKIVWTPPPDRCNKIITTEVGQYADKLGLCVLPEKHKGGHSHLMPQTQEAPTLLRGKEEAEEAVRRLLDAFGLDRNSEHFSETPRRVWGLLAEFCNPDTDLQAILKTGFDNGHERNETGAMVVQTNIPLRGLCAHHLCPFFGTAAVGYIPGERIVGLSKLARLVDATGTMCPSTQEAITNKVADVLHEGIQTKGVMVVTKALHTCMSVRGVNTPNVYTTVSAIRGNFIHVPAAKQEFLALIREG
jgi:GTP cyclohydrolase I